MLILSEAHFLVTEKNRGVTSLQTGYLLIVRFKYTTFSIVALNFWSHGHRIALGCNSVIAGGLSGDFHRYLVVLLVWGLVSNQATASVNVGGNWRLLLAYTCGRVALCLGSSSFRVPWGAQPSGILLTSQGPSLQ